MMERLTGRNEKGELLVNGKVVYAGELYEVASALEEYEDMEEQGKMLILPCKPGDTVYYIYMDCPEDYKKEYCTDHEGSCEKCPHRVGKILSTKYVVQENVGRPVYLTEPEAEKALEGMKK